MTPEEQARFDMFAAAALQGLMANNSAMAMLQDEHVVARKAVLLACAMMTELDMKARAAK